jgi:hypothetical protein
MSDNVIELQRTVGAPRDLMLQDLQRSGLVPEDLSCRVMENPERAATKTGASTNGYAIPYWDIHGKPIGHYRVRLFDSETKYRQPKDTPNHLYYPRGFLSLAKGRSVIYLTEGEKKAALAAKLGYPTIGLGGVDAWRNRILELPGDAELTSKTLSSGGKRLHAKLDSGERVTEDYMSQLAIGFQDMTDLLLELDATLVIIFDSNRMFGVTGEVQRAAATLGYELRSKGLPFTKIRQLILPFDVEVESDELGLDDYLLADSGTEQFNYHVRHTLEKRSAFPRHPSVIDYVGKRLQKSKMSRKEQQQVSIAILTELDATGIRMRSPDEKQTYYFDHKTKHLMKAGFLKGIKDEAHDTPFGGLLYRKFGLSANDQKILVWLSAQFNGEDPVEDVFPQRVLARPVRGADAIHYQLNDGQYVTVTAEDITIRDNGADGILFEVGHVAPILASDLKREFTKVSRQPVTNWWREVLKDVRLKNAREDQRILSLLYYISPWLNRWRGTQLPIEMVLGESGSGKSTLCEFRLSILTGDPRLRNRPNDIKDWNASIANTGALHITDNVQMTDAQMRNHLSDELCRIVTEPNPSVEARKLYSNNEIIRFPVRSTFVLTAITQPFRNADLIQRSIITELDKPVDPTKEVTYDMAWTERHLESRGGRVAWVAHHLYVLQRFFQLTKSKWNTHYKARHRLINLEQSLMLMSEIFDPQADHSWLTEHLIETTEDNLSSADHAYEGIKEYIEGWKVINPYWEPTHPQHNRHKSLVLASEISAWAQAEDDYKKNDILTSSRKLGRYMQTHKSMLANGLGLVALPNKYGNKTHYKVVKTRKEEGLNQDQKNLLVDQKKSVD